MSKIETKSLQSNLSCAVNYSEYRVYFEDTDSGGVVYHANFLKFMERARSDWLAEFGCLPSQPADQWGVIFAVRSLTLEFLKPARLGDLLKVSVRPDSVLGASLLISQTILDEGSEVLVRGNFRIACIDSSNFKVQRIPLELRRMLT